MKHKKILITLLFILLLISLTGCKKEAGNTPTSSWQTYQLSKSSLTAEVNGSGTVKAWQTAELRWQVNGIVGDIYVKAGDEVEKDQLLAVLDEDNLPKTIIEARKKLNEAENALQKAQENGLEYAQARIAAVEAQKALTQAEKNLETLELQKASQRTLQGLRGELAIAKENLEIAENLYGWADGKQDQSIKDISRAEALNHLAVSRKVYEKAVSNLNYALNLPNEEKDEQLQAAYAQAQSNLADALQKLNKFDENGKDQDAIAIAEAQIAAAKAVLAYQEVRAPFSGTVTHLNILPQDIIESGSLAMRLDNINTLQVEIPVSETEIHQIIIGQKTQISFPSSKNGELYEGIVRQINRSGTDSYNGTKYPVSIDLIGNSEELKLGITAVVNICTGEVQDGFIVPTRTIQVNGDKKIVYILKNEQPVSVSIETGLSYEGKVEIISNQLNIGDKLILNPPASK